MGKYFKMSAAGGHYWLKKLRYSYKKRICLEANKDKRAKYKEAMKDIGPEKLVYIDCLCCSHINDIDNAIKDMKKKGFSLKVIAEFNS